MTQTRLEPLSCDLTRQSQVHGRVKSLPAASSPRCLVDLIPKYTISLVVSRREHHSQYIVDPMVFLDDSAMLSSPLKQVAARHQLHRSRTAPATVSNDVLKMSTRPKVTRSPSEEFLVLERAHDVVTSGASKMGLQELLEASRMVNSIGTALSEQMSRKLSSDSLASL